jgi:hypothetical protein
MSFIDSKWSKCADIYEKVWNKAQQPVIRNIAAIRRGYEKEMDGTLDTNRADTMKKALEEVFKCGGISLTDAIEDRAKVTLIFDARHRDKVHDSIARLAS